MPDMCGICSTAISRSNHGIACEGQCSKFFHLKCVKLPTSFSELSADSGIKWYCQQCKDVNHIGKSHLDKLFHSISTIQSDLKIVKSTQSDVQDSLNFYGGKIDDFSAQMVTMQKTVQSLQVIKDDIVTLKNENAKLRTEIEVLHQQRRINNIEICGVPERKEENVRVIVSHLANKLNISLSDTDIEDCHRVMTFPNPNKNTAPRNIIVRFLSCNKKREFINASRKMKTTGLKISDIGFTGDGLVYVNEHLSPFYKMLFKNAREFCRTNNYKYCWVKESKIFIKKIDSSKVIHVSNEDTLKKLIS